MPLVMKYECITLNNTSRSSDYQSDSKNEWQVHFIFINQYCKHAHNQAPYNKNEEIPLNL